MITNRLITSDDYSLLETSLLLDDFHKETPLGFFLQPETITSVYEDDKGIVLFVRGSAFLFNELKCVRLDIQFLDNKDFKRNIKTMLEGFPLLADKAKENGFDVIVFESMFDPLRKFCIKRLGFEIAVDSWLVKIL